MKTIVKVLNLKYFHLNHIKNEKFYKSDYVSFFITLSFILNLVISSIQEKYGNGYMSVTQRKIIPECTQWVWICSNQICNCK